MQKRQQIIHDPYNKEMKERVDGTALHQIESDATTIVDEDGNGSGSVSGDRESLLVFGPVCARFCSIESKPFVAAKQSRFFAFRIEL